MLLRSQLGTQRGVTFCRSSECGPLEMLAGHFWMSSSFHFAGIHLVHVAPDPSLSRLDGANQWVRGPFKMFGGMLILRGIAAAHVPANQAEPQMHPGIAQLDAFLAPMFGCVFDLDLLQMSTISVGGFHEAEFLSSEALSHAARLAPASYALCANSRISARGDFARRTSSYISRKSCSLPS